MPTGPGALDAQGVWQFGEDDTESLASDLLNLLAAATSTQFGVDRGRLTTLEGHEVQRRQLDTTNSSLVPLIQSGIGKIQGNNTTGISEAVTFPVAFSAAPVVLLNYIGYRATGAFNPIGLSFGGALAASAAQPATNQFLASIFGSGAFSNTLDWYYSWIAIGPR